MPRKADHFDPDDEVMRPVPVYRAGYGTQTGGWRPHAGHQQQLDEQWPSTNTSVI